MYQGFQNALRGGDWPQSLPYGFQNEIMDHPCSDGGPESNRIECTKFNDGCTKFNQECTKFCEECTKNSKMHFEVGIDPQHFLMGSKMKSWTIYVQMGYLEVIRFDVLNLMKDVPNFLRMYQGFQSAFRCGNQLPINFLWVPK